jgi:hypothetical protein
MCKCGSCPTAQGRYYLTIVSASDRSNTMELAMTTQETLNRWADYFTVQLDKATVQLAASVAASSSTDIETTVNAPPPKLRRYV